MPKFALARAEDESGPERDKIGDMLLDALPEIALLSGTDEEGMQLVRLNISLREDGSWLLSANITSSKPVTSPVEAGGTTNRKFVSFAGSGSLVGCLSKWESQLREGNVRISPDQYEPQSKQTLKGYRKRQNR